MQFRSNIGTIARSYYGLRLKALKCYQERSAPDRAHINCADSHILSLIVFALVNSKDPVYGIADFLFRP